MRLVETFRNRVEAHMYSEVLRKENIHFVLKVDDCGGSYPSLARAQGVKIFVKDSDFDYAKNLLQE